MRLGFSLSLLVLRFPRSGDFVDDGHHHVIHGTILGDRRLPCAGTGDVEHHFSLTGADRIRSHDDAAVGLTLFVSGFHEEQFQPLKLFVFFRRDHGPDDFADMHCELHEPMSDGQCQMTLSV